MKNVTISLDEEVARWARIHAATNEMSVSRMVGEILRRQMLAERGYESARVEFFEVKPQQLSENDTPYPSRDDLHERADLR